MIGGLILCAGAGLLGLGMRSHNPNMAGAGVICILIGYLTIAVRHRAGKKGK